MFISKNVQQKKKRGKKTKQILTKQKNIINETKEQININIKRKRERKNISITILIIFC